MSTVPDFMPVLRHGAGATPNEGGCLVQVASWLGRQEWSDDPDTCGVHHLLRSTCIEVNDWLPVDMLHRIAPLAASIAATDTRYVGEADSFSLHKMRSEKAKLVRCMATGSFVVPTWARCEHGVISDNGEHRAEAAQKLTDWLRSYVEAFLSLANHTPATVTPNQWATVRAISGGARLPQLVKA